MGVINPAYLNIEKKKFYYWKVFIKETPVNRASLTNHSEMACRSGKVQWTVFSDERAYQPLI